MTTCPSPNELNFNKKCTTTLKVYSTCLILFGFAFLFLGLAKASLSLCRIFAFSLSLTGPLGFSSEEVCPSIPSFFFRFRPGVVLSGGPRPLVFLESSAVTPFASALWRAYNHTSILLTLRKFLQQTSQYT